MIDGLVSRTFDYCFGTSVAGIDGCWDLGSIIHRSSEVWLRGVYATCLRFCHRNSLISLNDNSNFC